MCGIIGIIGKSNVAEDILDGLRRLEYRGYDSAGIATIEDGEICRLRAEGKLRNLEQLLRERSLSGHIGIGHTRWATHGVPNEINAHPHATDQVAVVHNGIIENFHELKRELEEKGFEFTSETDTEVVPILISDYLRNGLSPKDAFSKALAKLHGAFAIGVIFAQDSNVLFAARQGSPLAIGYGDGEMFIGSDAVALAPLTRRICYLDEGDWAEIHHEGAMIYDRDGQEVEREIKLTSLTGAGVGKGDYRHFMLKEIFEQPGVIGETLNAYCNPLKKSISLPELPFKLAEVSKITMVACGTSYYAASVAKYWLEQVAHIPVEIDIASEFRYRQCPLPENGLALFISQSGETADTLAAMRFARDEGQKLAAIVNVPESTMAREAQLVLSTFAGPEIGVASTKAFTAQLTTLACFAIAVARARGVLNHHQETELVHQLSEVAARASEVLELSDYIHDMAHNLVDARDVLYLGRGTSYPIALEGALKLKEISYIHAEGYAAGELKHGPIALVDESVPTIVIAPSDNLFEKTLSNMQEVAARGGRVMLISDAKGIELAGDLAEVVIRMPETSLFSAPLLYAIPVQLIAYHVAVLKGTDVDQPRNLAKSVTVE